MGISNLPTEKQEPLQTTEIVESDGKNVVVADIASIKKHLKDLDSTINTVEKTFFKIGSLLYWFYDTEAFTQIDGKNYNSISDFAKDRYRISKATTYQYITIMEKFGIKDDKGDFLLNEAYQRYSSTQLIEMAKLDNETLQKCNPNMKVRELKELVKAQKALSSDNQENAQIMPESLEVLEIIDAENGLKIPENPSNHTEELFSVSSIDDFEKRQSEIIACIREKFKQNTDGVLVIQYQL